MTFVMFNIDNFTFKIFFIQKNFQIIFFKYLINKIKNFFMYCYTKNISKTKK